jgi:(S)-2-hydroxyglutarate dehydrogenase
MSSHFDVTLAGGGIVGLATALALVRRAPRLRVCVLEKEPELATHQSGHNSGVLHSGLYYRPGSLKAQLCVDGQRQMVELCRQNEVRHEICGKLVVATCQRELPALAELARRGRENGVGGLELAGPERIRQLEPHARGLKALWVPSTGICDFRQAALAMARLVLEAGGEVRTGCGVLGLERSAAGKETCVRTSRAEVRTTLLVNCGGLQADRLARLGGADPGVRIVPFRGEYYKLVPGREGLVRGLIYPVPDARLPFLGVHFTRRVDGSVEAGPNAVLAFAREGYRWSRLSLRDCAEVLAYPGFWRMAARFWRTGVHELGRSLSKGAFTRALQRLVPDLCSQDLEPGGSGVRAQALSASGALLEDFHVVQAPGALHVLNAPSPAATASLAIGAHLAALACERLGHG